MVIWTANLIRLPARQSNSTCGTALTASKDTWPIVRLFMQSAAPCLITRLQQNCVSGFSPHCERRLRNGLCEILGEMFSRCFQEGSQGRGRFFLGHHGIGSLSLRPSFLQPLSAGTYCLDCSDLMPNSFLRRNLLLVMCVR